MEKEELAKSIYYIVYRTLDIWLGIWAINHLFHTDIHYTFWNCVAAWVLIAIVDSDGPLLAYERKYKQ